ncbi:response regulator transcription factor, partial [Bacteroidales bacterium OttesenSCG-928-K22]|nr:response regulator transcription factor [Bacteroidales bacterium OttesenSCG-928-K22]
KKILLFEDDMLLAEMTKLNLELVGTYNIHIANTGKKSLERILTFSPDICLVDIMLPEKNGYEVVREMRLNHINIPVIFISALTAPEDALVAFELGCDDYIRKPFDIFELIARINVALRIYPEGKKIQPGKTNKNALVFKFPGVTFNFINNTIECDNIAYNLSPYESDIMRILVNNIGEIVSYDDLFLKTGREKTEKNRKSFYVILSNLRNKFNNLDCFTIITYRRKGIKMVV